MIVSFSPGNVKELQSFFKLDSSIDFLDLMITRNTILVIAVGMEVYSHYPLDVLSREDYIESVSLRISRKRFLSLISEGVVTLYIQENESVEIVVKPAKGGEYSYKESFQASDLSSIYRNLDLLEEEHAFTEIALGTLAKPLRVVRSLSQEVNVVDESVVVERPGMSLYYRIKCPNVNLSSNVVNYMLRYGEKFYGYKNYIISMSEGPVIISRQVKPTAYNNLDYIMGRNYTKKFTTNFKDLCDLVRRCDIEEDITVDFDAGKATINDGKASFSTAVPVQDIQSNSALKAQEVNLDMLSLSDETVVSTKSIHDLPTLVFPIKIVSDVISNLDKEAFIVKVKKEFVQMEFDNGRFFLMLRRNEIA